MQPLEGLKVIDITRALAGPYCTMMLADLGADVIKVERPGRGDESRGWGPPFVGEPSEAYPGESAYFMAVNRNKRSLTVNLKIPDGQDIIQKLAATSDVFVENFRTGVLDNMGLGYEELHKLNPRLVYCSISGYGRTGPYAEQPGYDFIIQAEGGIMGITGPEEGPPYRMGLSIVDITTGMFASTAILSALRARDITGEGQLVDISLFDSTVAVLANVASNYLVGGVEPRRMGNAHLNIAPYEVFRARDRWFALAAANNSQWGKLCDVIGREELKEDTRFLTNKDRVLARTELRALLNEQFSAQNADYWLEELKRAGLPCGPINSIQDVFTHPQVQARDLVVEIDHPTNGLTNQLGVPYKLSETPAEIRQPPPLLGEHTEEVLRERLGLSTKEISALRKHHAI